MEQPDFIRTSKEESPEEASEHAEAVALVEKHRDFFEHYAKGRIKIEPAPKGLNTFAFNLEKNTIYVNSMFYKKLGLSEEKTIFATLHKIEHFLEKLQVLGEDGGERTFKKYLGRIKESKAFGLLDNCVADIRENKTVVRKTSAGMGDLEVQTYKEDLFAERDFTSQPKHIQFAQALLRESRITDEKCIVAREVRQVLDEVESVKGLMETMTDPELPMSTRLKLQDKFLVPKMEALLEQDLEDKKKEKEEKEKQKKEQEKQEGEGEPNEGESGEEGEEKEPTAPSPSSADEGERGEERGEETDPNKVFADDYQKVEEKFPEAVPMEEIEKAFKDWQEAQKGKSSKEKADEEYAEKLGVEKKDLQKYREIAEKVEQMTNPETSVSVIEELRNLFRRIIAKRLKPALAPKYPVEEGDELVDPAQLIADVKSGNLQPKVWEDTEIKEKRGEHYGEVEISLICDRSSSMNDSGGQKAEEQRKSAVLVMEVLKEFAELSEAEKINISKPLLVRSEIYGFGAGEDKKPMKEMSAELGEAERIKVLKDLFNLPGSTTDFNCLEAIGEKLDQKTKDKIKIGELKKIVIVFTDGGSDNALEVQVQLKNLRDNGIIVVGVGITSSGAPTLTTYAPNALVVEDVSKVSAVLGELLKEHLKDL
jgi:hypothetical protein